MRHQFTANLPRRSVELEIIEALDAIYLNLSCSNVDNLQEDMEFMLWLLPIISRYENDTRPVVITSPNSEITGVIVS
jgi:hypothetical protein